MQRIAEARATNPEDPPSMWWFDVNRRLTSWVWTLLLLRRAERRGRLHMSAIQMRTAARLARRLKLLLTNRIDLPSEAWELLKSPDPFRPAPASRLEAAADALDRLADQPGRKPKNDVTAVERKVASELARELLPTVRTREVLVPAVVDIFEALGLKLDAKPIAVAVRRVLD
ncbi:MAG TPA: hypothetical protein VEA81_17685 [Burkholderiaceae bacterium]|nr:hypothetical protein [Burkholderiaceae bacterium]